VGVATPSIEASVALYRDVLGATKIGEKFAMPEQGVWVCFVDLPNSQIELIEPHGEASPLKGFLEKNPAGGQHHICFEVADIEVARDDMVAKGATVLNGGKPRIGRCRGKRADAAARREADTGKRLEGAGDRAADGGCKNKAGNDAGCRKQRHADEAARRAPFRLAVALARHDRPASCPACLPRQPT
jgi:methylmalonyl-CoA/ethylmalonyl-CoA epimerase